MKVVEAIVFDLDGTLVDSARDIVAALNHALGAAGWPLVDDAAARLIISVGLERMVELAVERSGRPATEAELTGLKHEAIQYYDRHLLDHTRMYPGTARMLTYFRRREILLGICTNKLFRPTCRVLSGLGMDDSFGAIIGRDSVGERKPHPAPLLAALKGLGVHPEHAVMVGDSEVDVACARSAGVKVIAVSHGYSEIPSAELGADEVIDHFTELLPAIEAI